ncbi:5-methylcytosine-specific restriction endonuclease system specificity protein McrC [Aquibaculum arenosum]|uniref:5-methylcytosine-specific restriction endonuclease system specificity protein McrC n=1 Tax=Aquibaculum arenosum TaxID=3032591 RepID=A0ABT5YP46_9PROT|nr:5-methylcytosine-specific restriction endonuclease system specificity protein McrC [Fodinicurvata sp. CAU 1616]MDF2096603.1 5-methylcytosine-specific restriction endonuclease system specificity protein McrC [Fodinicurvata sp. CAU 1616]
MSAASDFAGWQADEVELAYDKIPIRNVWLLFLYANDLARFQGRFDAEIEDSPDLKSLIARLLCHAVETRLQRNLSFGYRRRADTLKRVRGRIEILETESRALFRRGEVACRFDEFTIDTPRNRLVRAALTALSGRVSNPSLSHRTRTLSGALARAGVSGQSPSRAEFATDQIARHEGEDKLMVSLARAVFELVLPTEQEGVRSLFKASRGDTAFRKLFERAIGRFFAEELSRKEGWRVYPGKQISWPVGAASPGIRAHLPMMVTDIILENEREDRRIIIDTKFTSILTDAHYGMGQRFKTGHIYQLYAYLRSQEKEDDPRSLNSEGILLYPALGVDVDEAAELQGHRLRFATVNLAQPTASVIETLRQLPVLSRLDMSHISATGQA